MPGCEKWWGGGGGGGSSNMDMLQGRESSFHFMTGKTNGFHIACSTDLARCYNDNSVLENHHCALTFDLINKCNLIGHLEKATQQVEHVLSKIRNSNDIGFSLGPRCLSCWDRIYFATTSMLWKIKSDCTYLQFCQLTKNQIAAGNQALKVTI